MESLIPAANLESLFVVVVHDPVTKETDTYGPLDEWRALEDADRRRREFDAEGLDDVVVLIIPVHQPNAPEQPPESHE